ncbi:MAG: IS1595 family transposase, partial [Sphingobacteriales bacterium]
YIKENVDREFRDKTPVLGLRQSGGKVRCFVIPNTKAETINPLVLANVAPGSTLYTDEWHGYKRMGEIYNHGVVFHGKGQYKNGNACTNGIEGF